MGWEKAAEATYGSQFVVPETSSCRLVLPRHAAGGRSV